MSADRLVVYNQKIASERASYNGSIEASQASDVGSIPIARSRNSIDSNTLAGLNLHKSRASWTQLDADLLLRVELDAAGAVGIEFASLTSKSRRLKALPRTLQANCWNC